jgi:hypothetical protein
VEFEFKFEFFQVIITNDKKNSHVEFKFHRSQKKTIHDRESESISRERGERQQRRRRGEVGPVATQYRIALQVQSVHCFVFLHGDVPLSPIFISVNNRTSGNNMFTTSSHYLTMTESKSHCSKSDLGFLPVALKLTKALRRIQLSK